MGGRSRLGPDGQECDEELKESDHPEVNPTTAANAETQLLSFTISAPPISNLLKASLEVDGCAVFVAPGVDGGAAGGTTGDIPSPAQVEASSEEAAGVITGGIPSQGREEASTAGVITGGDEGFRLRLAHTRYPWLDDFMLLMSGHRRNGCGRPLFDVSELSHVSIPDGWNMSLFLIDLFFQKRFYSRNKDMKYDAMARSSPDALAESWDVFVEGLVEDEDAWMAGFKKVKAAFMKYNLDGDKIQVHVQSIAEGVPCCVTTDQRCPMCYLDSPKATGVVRRGEVGNISTELYHLIKHLDLRWRFRSRAVAEDKARKRMMQSDVLDDMPLAQVDPSKSEQRLRDIQTDVYLAGLSSHQVRETVKSLVEYRVSAEGQIKNLERQFEEIQTLLYNSGIYQRQRK